MVEHVGSETSRGTSAECKSWSGQLLSKEIGAGGLLLAAPKVPSVLVGAATKDESRREEKDSVLEKSK